VRRALRIAVLTRKPDAISNRLLAAAAETRGHTLELIDADALTLSVEDGRPVVLGAGERLAHYDAVIPRVVDRMGAAIVRQLELMGCSAINSGDALDRLANPLATVQALVRAGVPTLAGQLKLAGPDAEAEAAPAIRSSARRVEATVIGGATMALAERRHKVLRDVPERRLIAARRLAERAARALKLGLARIEISATGEGVLTIAAVSALPSLSQVKRISGVQAAEAVIAQIEREVRSWVRREDAVAADVEVLDETSDDEAGGGA